MHTYIYIHPLYTQVMLIKILVMATNVVREQTYCCSFIRAEWLVTDPGTMYRPAGGAGGPRIGDRVG